MTLWSKKKSAKLAFTLENTVKPLLQNPRYEGKVKVIFRPHVQPWHVMSTITHEAGLAVSALMTESMFGCESKKSQALRASPEHFWPFSMAVSFIFSSFIPAPQPRMYVP